MRNGIEVYLGGHTVRLDPRRAEGVSFISHAHSDHRPSTFSGKVVASRETSALMGLGADETRETLRLSDNMILKTVPSGHILGSSQLIMENGTTVVYTGDLNVEGGFTTPPAEIPPCDVLIMECTFGSPFYRFPDKREVLKDMVDWIDESFSHGQTPVIMGYAMGKAQELTRALSREYQVVVHRKVYENNRLYEALGTDLGGYSLVGDGDRVIIMPPGRTNLMGLKGLETRTAVATGWACHGGVAPRYGADCAFPLSDHSDFDGLLKYVERASPQVVYTHHGCSEEFSQELRQRGFYSEPL
jgi:putative mRNA 3-end processing factor